MSNRILVAYASRTGTTAGVAEIIGQALTASGAEVDVRRMTDVHDLSPYQAVVAGSAINNGEWLPEAIAFVREYRAALASKPFAAFLVCMTMSMKNEKYRQGVADWMAPVHALVTPAAEGYFAGALDLDKVPSFGKRLAFRVAVASGLWSEGDHRDPDAIRAWTNNLLPILQH